MALSSMTGYARTDGAAGDRTWFWEARSVNGRSLDVRCRLPQGFEEVEREARAAIASRFSRGNVSLSLTVVENAHPTLILNTKLLDQVVSMAGSYAQSSGLTPPSLDSLLGLRGIVEATPAAESEKEKAERLRSVTATLDRSVTELAKARLDEGARLATILDRHLDEIERLILAAASAAAAQPERIKGRLIEQIRDVLGAEPRLSEDRIAQEVAVLIVKGDVREELDRLRAHLGQARDLVANGAAVGRRLDFLTQEFNREANTLCSKSADIELTRIGLDLKTAIDRLREQVQNVE